MKIRKYNYDIFKEINWLARALGYLS